MPKVLNSENTNKGTYIGRPSVWGNPFIIGRDGTRIEVIEKYEHYINRNQKLQERAKRELKGQDLRCFCAPLPCHGDMLLKIANE